MTESLGTALVTREWLGREADTKKPNFVSTKTRLFPQECESSPSPPQQQRIKTAPVQPQRLQESSKYTVKIIRGNSKKSWSNSPIVNRRLKSPRNLLSIIYIQEIISVDFISQSNTESRYKKHRMTYSFFGKLLSGILSEKINRWLNRWKRKELDVSLRTVANW